MSGCEPELRFREFNGEWEEKKFEDFVKVNQGLQIAISERFLENGPNRYFYITNEFLKENPKFKYYIENPPKSVICDRDDILMTRTGNTGKVVTGEKGAFHNNFFKIQFDYKTNKMFLYYILTSNKIQNNILRLAGTSTIPDLNHGDFYSIEVNVPLFEEQEKIANFLSKVDEKIAILEEKLELWNSYKKGIMQQLFSQELRFKGFSQNWINNPLGEIAFINKGFTPSTSDSSNWDGELPWLSIADMKGGKYLEHTSKFITKKGSKNKEIIAKGSLIMSFKLTIGRLAILGVDMFTNEAICNFQWKNDEISTEYMYYYLNSINILKYGSQAAKGVTLNNDSLKTIPIKLPDLEEQEKIAKFLIKIDEKIIELENKLEKANEFKKGLLQKMFC